MRNWKCIGVLMLATIISAPIAIAGAAKPPWWPDDFNTPPLDCDLNGDGLLEDVNYDGKFNFGDVVYLFNNLDKLNSIGWAKYYDFNDDGILNFGDVVALFKML